VLDCYNMPRASSICLENQMDYYCSRCKSSIFVTLTGCVPCVFLNHSVTPELSKSILLLPMHIVTWRPCTKTVAIFLQLFSRTERLWSWSLISRMLTATWPTVCR